MVVGVVIWGLQTLGLTEQILPRPEIPDVRTLHCSVTERMRVPTVIPVRQSSLLGEHTGV